MSKHICIKSLCVALVFFCASFTAKAQQIETSVYLNGTLPVGQFNDQVELTEFGQFTPMNRTNVAQAAAGGLGFTARFGMWFDVGVGQLQPFVEASFLWNNSRKYVRDIYDNNERNDTMKSYPTAPQYFNIPVMLGLKYRYDITADLRPFAELGIGYDLLIITKNGYPSERYSYKMNGQLCWMGGLGTYLGEHVSATLFYMGLGSHRIEYTAKSFKPEGDDFNATKRSLGVLGLRVGFHF